MGGHQLILKHLLGLKSEEQKMFSFPFSIAGLLLLRLRRSSWFSLAAIKLAVIALFCSALAFMGFESIHVWTHFLTFVALMRLLK